MLNLEVSWLAQFMHNLYIFFSSFQLSLMLKSMAISRKYFSWIGLLKIDLIYQSRRLHVFLPGAALIHINLFKVINFFQINSSDQYDLILTDQLKLLYSSYLILYYSFQSIYTSKYNGSTYTSAFLGLNLLYQLLIRFYNLFHFK